MHFWLRASGDKEDMIMAPRRDAKSNIGNEENFKEKNMEEI